MALTPEISSDIKKLKEPGTRILVFILITAVVALFWLFVNKGTGNETALKNEIKELQNDKKVLQHSIDSIQLRRWEEKTETVNELRNILKGQDSVKTTLRSLK